MDGSNLRFEWSKKQGWYKFGTRTKLIDDSDVVFYPAIALFKETLADDIEKVATAHKWESVVAYAEFYGKHSFAGQHVEEDEKHLNLFDISPYKRGILYPVQYLDLFGHLNIAKYLGKYEWNEDFVERVKNFELEGITFEGVVGKSVRNNTLYMVKAKTQKWIEKVQEKFTKNEAEQIINS